MALHKHKISTEGIFSKPQDRFINRELSWLEFNFRVLEEALNPKVPLLERVKFLSISASNLDEFFMVRVAGLRDQIKNDVTEPSIDGLTPLKQLQQVYKKALQLMQEQQNCWKLLESELQNKRVSILKPEALSLQEKKKLKTHFMNNIFPALSPIAIDPAHPFPFLPNLGMAVIMQFEGEGEQKKDRHAVILMPAKLGRFVRINGSKDKFILLENVIEMFAGDLFPTKKIKGFTFIHITRDSDLEIEDEAEDLVSNFESAVKKRRRGEVIMLKIATGTVDDLKKFIITSLKLNDGDIAETMDMPGLDSVMELFKLNRPKLKYKKYEERFPERINDFGGDCFAAIAAKDIIIHHPYETFDVVVNFLRQAAHDPDVIAIKQTLYRTSSDSPIVQALIEAAEAGKSVTVVVELKARFDEESNIKWARNLERAGAQVVFGFVELKTHAKVSLVVKREGENLQSYVHFGTGNYHPVTARTYSDLSFFTCDKALCGDAALLFNYLTGYSSPDDFSDLTISPTGMRKKIMRLIDDEIEYAKAGKPAFIWAKMNSLIDPDIIDALYYASQQGVSIELVVRGICGLRPGIKGLSENIRVKSLVGRFLEHTRIMCFGSGNELPSPKAKVFISSADWMQRNLNGRVEVLVPIKNKTVHEQVMGQIMFANLKDEKQSWDMNPDGTYTRRNTENIPHPFSAHEYFMTNPSLSGRGKALTEAESEKQRRKIYKLFKFDKRKT